MPTRPMMSEVKMVFFFRCKKFTNAHEKIHSICEDYTKIRTPRFVHQDSYTKISEHFTANVFVAVQILGQTCSSWHKS